MQDCQLFQVEGASKFRTPLVKLGLPLPQAVSSALAGEHDCAAALVRHRPAALYGPAAMGAAAGASLVVVHEQVKRRKNQLCTPFLPPHPALPPLPTTHDARSLHVAAAR